MPLKHTLRRLEVALRLYENLLITESLARRDVAEVRVGQVQDPRHEPRLTATTGHVKMRTRPLFMARRERDNASALPTSEPTRQVRFQGLRPWS